MDASKGPCKSMCRRSIVFSAWFEAVWGNGAWWCLPFAQPLHGERSPLPCKFMPVTRLWQSRQWRLFTPMWPKRACQRLRLGEEWAVKVTLWQEVGGAITLLTLYRLPQRQPSMTILPSGFLIVSHPPRFVISIPF